MSVRTILATAILCLFLPSCIVFYPEVKNNERDCQLLSRERTLERKVIYGTLPTCSSDEASCASFLAAVVAVPVTTIVLSGSIVVVGNTVHWMERQGKCEDGYLKQKMDEFKRLLTNQSG